MSQVNDPMYRINAVRNSIAAKTARLYEPVTPVEPLPDTDTDTDTEPTPTGTDHENTFGPLHWSEGVVTFTPNPQIGAGVIAGQSVEDSIRVTLADYLNKNR